MDYSPTLLDRFGSIDYWNYNLTSKKKLVYTYLAGKIAQYKSKFAFNEPQKLAGDKGVKKSSGWLKLVE